MLSITASASSGSTWCRAMCSIFCASHSNRAPGIGAQSSLASNKYRLCIDKDQVGSRRQPLDDPAISCPAVAEAVVEAAGTTLPELDAVGDDAVAAPEGGAGDGGAGEAGGDLGDAGFEGGAVGDGLALGRGPG